MKTTPVDKLQKSIDLLRMVYNPPVRGSLRRNKELPLPLTARVDWHTDAFERNYSMKWLSALISQLQSTDHSPLREKVIEDAASLLATCAGTASAGTVSRSFVFHTAGRHGVSSQAITVELKDVPLDNHDYRSVGGQTWGSGCIMADMIAENPLLFGIPPYDRTVSFRCLELGAGTGLVSLTVAKILMLHLGVLDVDLVVPPEVKVELVATDYYPAVLENLERNIQANSIEGSPLPIHSIPLDWSLFFESDAASDPAALRRPFDVIYGADIVYERRHAEWIKGCLMKLLKRPDKSDKDPAFHLIIPLRRTHAFESNTIDQAFEPQAGSDRDLIIKHKEVVVCESETGSAEEIEHVYYRIGWKT